MHQTNVIWTSIDRPGVALCVVPVPRGKLTSWDSLYFLFKSAVGDGHATPANIPKTIVFIDQRTLIGEAAAWAMDMLLFMSNEYLTLLSAKERCVYNIIRGFTAHVSESNKKHFYDEFKDPSSGIRIMIATTSLGVGVNIPDVARIVTWMLPITKSLADLWQRIGRGGRGIGRTGIAILMLPY
ncbi:hypothetical protein EJ02DRAFT_357830, partial [Clathrospora elynae]